MNKKVCFLGGSRYSRPLDPTNEKKFRAMKSLAKIFVVGFSRDLQSRCFTEHAHFYLLPQIRLPLLRYLELFFFGQILLFWLVVRHRIQVVITQSPYEGLAAAMAIEVARWFGYKVRLVVEVHGDFENSLFLQREIQFPGLYRRFMNFAARYSIGRADLLRTISNSSREQLKRWVSEKEIIQFPAWTDIEVFSLAARRHRSPMRQNILYAGVLTPLKGVHHLIDGFVEIADEFPEARLFIVGKDENRGYAADLRKQVKKLGLEGCVQFIGPVPQAELASSMANASVLVLPSASEGLPRVVVESMATGTPVIGSRVGGIPELVEDGVRGFLIPHGDKQALAEKISWVLRNPDKAAAMGERARAFAERFFSTESYLKGYRRVFEDVEPEIGRREHAPSTL